MCERGLDVEHSTVYRWVQRYAPEIKKRIRQHLKMSGTSYGSVVAKTFRPHKIMRQQSTLSPNSFVSQNFIRHSL
jgi:hypothetical protein